jgi:hypothetical protein
MPLTICKLHLSRICDVVFPYFFAIGTNKGSSAFCALTIGQSRFVGIR